jgi:protein involved in polysaccharide export with SLBB domain
MLGINLAAQIDMQQVYYNISVTGAVSNPGVYHLPPTSRLSEAIKIAQGELSVGADVEDLEQPELENIPQNGLQIPSSNQFLPEKEEKFSVSLRNISLKRKKEIIIVDLQKFLLLGDEKENPFLLDGDLIFVPALTNKVEIIGEVVKPGEYEIQEGERITDILEFALGLTEAAYLDKVEIIRYDNNDRFTKLEINLSKVLADPANEANVILQNDDRIYIRTIPYFQQYDEVTIFGEVEFPGTYIIENNTTLREILTKVGSLTEYADLNNSFLQRKNLEENYDAEFERLKYIPINNMTYFEYEYFKTRAKELKGKFSIDIEQIYESEEQGNNIVLRHGDFIYIAEKINAVIVSGQVKEPGLITYVPGKSPDYYIDQAGGLGWKARKGKIRIIRAETGEWLKPDKDLIVEEGDTILIPYRPDWNYWEIFKDTIVVLSQIATLFLVIQNVK